jgi:hypothetical protein
MDEVVTVRRGQNSAMRRACMSHWLPTLISTGVPVPETRLITTDMDLLMVLEDGTPGHEAEWKAFLAEVRTAAEVVGYPFFLRTGHGSGKHDWRRTCHVPDSAAVPSHIGALVEWSACVDLMGLPTKVWAVRRFLRLQSSFTAFNGFPVNRERRYFVEGGKVLCSHPYWPEYAIDGHQPSESDWRERLAALNDATPEETALLTIQSERVSAAFEGAWSLDWAQDIDGTWWAIDMAPAERSYHWPDCPKETHS